MIPYGRCALLIALIGIELLFFVKGKHLLSEGERRLTEASRYTIIDVTPPPENL